MSSYEPDPKTAKLFARHKQAAETIKETRKLVLTAAEEAIRNGATNPELAGLTGMSDETFRKLAEKLGIDNRLKAPTVGREVEARRAQPVAEPRERPSPPAEPAPTAIRLPPRVMVLSDRRARHFALRAHGLLAGGDQKALLTAAGDNAAEAGANEADQDRAVVAAAMALEPPLLTANDLLSDD